MCIRDRLLAKIDNSTGSSLRVTGFCVNLLTLQPEVCLLLFVNDPDWMRAEANAEEYPMKFGWEIADVGDQLQSWQLPLDENFRATDGGRLGPGTLVPQAAAALKLGLDLLRSERGLVV